MTMFTSFSVVTIVLLVSGAAMVASRIVDESLYPPSIVRLYPPGSEYGYSASPKTSDPPLTEQIHELYLEDCASKVTEKCGREIFSYVFENGTTYTNDCCKKLKLIGKECHTGMVKYSVDLPENKPNAAAVLAKSEQIWNKCASVA